MIALAVDGAFDESKRDFTFPTPAGMCVRYTTISRQPVADGIKIRKYVDVLKPVFKFVEELEGEHYLSITRGMLLCACARLYLT